MTKDELEAFKKHRKDRSPKSVCQTSYEAGYQAALVATLGRVELMMPLFVNAHQYEARDALDDMRRWLTQALAEGRKEDK